MAVSYESQEMVRERELRRAYEDGHRSGRLDLYLGYRSLYSWHSASDSGYPGAYGQGYRDAQNRLAANNPWAVLA